ncbi:MAG: SIR2 family protein, partial [Deltaproteobacteria bacterium]|nr:SIR2 family protein [Deltaproteobacteria bacterium]
MKVEFPKALFERVRAGNVVLCTGVRLAATSGMPTWEDLLGKMAAQLNGEHKGLDALVKAGKLLTVVGYLKRKLGEAAVDRALKDAFGASTDPSMTHKWLHQIPFHAALSTGYDCLLENALRDKSAPKVFGYEDGAVLRLQEELKHYVLKVHGDVQLPQKAILSVSDFKREIIPNEPYRAFLEDLFRTRTLLLVGYRSYDPDFVLFMDRLVSTFRDAAFDHYAILPDATGPEIDELYANFRMRVIPYEAGTNPEDTLGDVLKVFKEQFQQAGGTAEAVDDPVQWLQSQLSAVSVRVDVTAGQGLTLTRARLRRILDAAGNVELSALDAAALCRLGNVNLYLGEVQRGVECYNAALERDANFARAHLNLHHAMAELRQFVPALQHLERAAKADESLRVVPKRYELEAVIGRGSVGTVYQVRDVEGDEQLTLKVLRSDVVKEHVSAELWLEETSALLKLKHPHIVKTLDALIEGGRCVLVTENLQGRSLERMLREDGRLSPERAVELMHQIGAALSYAHGQGVLHLDVMPSNVFVRNEGGVALMDFRSGRAQKGRMIAAFP